MKIFIFLEKWIQLVCKGVMVVICEYSLKKFNEHMWQREKQHIIFRTEILIIIVALYHSQKEELKNSGLTKINIAFRFYVAFNY